MGFLFSYEVCRKKRVEFLSRAVFPKSEWKVLIINWFRLDQLERSINICLEHSLLLKPLLGKGSSAF